MTPYSFVVISLRLMAIWLIVQGAAESSQLVVTLVRVAIKHSTVDPFFMSLFSIPYVAQFILGLCLWFGTHSLSRYILANTANTAQLFRENQVEVNWQQIAFSTLGLYFLITGLSSVFGYTSGYILAAPEHKDVLQRDLTIYVTTNGLQLVLGFTLLLKARFLVRVLESARRGFRDESETERR